MRQHEREFTIEIARALRFAFRRMGVDGAWWLPRSSKPLRPDNVGLGGFDSHTLPPSRPRRAFGIPATIAITLAIPLVVLATNAMAQQPVPPARDTLPPRPEQDTLRARGEQVTQRVADSVPRPPISPRRAFLYSLVIPGMGQAKLDRAHAGAIFATLEGVAIAMAAKSSWLRRQARAHQDSIVVRWDPPQAPGGPMIPVKEMSRIGQRLDSRKQQVEDWVAVIIFNHIFAGADAFVAAQLWDLPRVIGSYEPGRTTIGLRFAW